MPPTTTAPPPATTSGQALANYQTAVGSEQSPDAIYNSESSSLGVPQAQQQVSGLRQAITNTTNLLNNVAPSTYGRTQNSLVTDAQANSEIANQSAPIQSKLSGLDTSETNAASDLSNLLTQAGNESSLKEQGQQDQLTALQNIYQSLYGQEQDSDTAQATAAQNAITNQQNQEKINQSGNSGPTYAAPTPTDTAAIANGLIKLSGSDGYVSPQTYSQAYIQWTAAGYSPTDFDKTFSKYKNPQNPNYTV